MTIRSKYTKNEFYCEVIGECSHLGEPAYLCRLLPEYQPRFADGAKPFALRKRLVDGELYEAVDQETKPTQLTLF